MSDGSLAGAGRNERAPFTCWAKRPGPGSSRSMPTRHPYLRWAIQMQPLVGPAPTAVLRGGELASSVPRAGPCRFCLACAQATLCRVCDVSVKGWCVHGQGNCTVDEGRSCRTRDVYYLDTRDGWVYNHTILDCASPCRAWKLFRSELKVSTYCCRGRDFCNTRRGVTVKKGAH
ncbi:hypothetical protein TREES_T100008350 [Tupaia chinensis]|uniref:Uncharacterized protein n=1 Tax=Tupaia chinensis TaxID=246437 RepID=L9LC14_TUPCH|nr:hypothetical protein TREES_T100008350 [Tupaia chinensis]